MSLPELLHFARWYQTIDIVFCSNFILFVHIFLAFKPGKISSNVMVFSFVIYLTFSPFIIPKRAFHTKARVLLLSFHLLFIFFWMAIPLSANKFRPRSESNSDAGPACVDKEYWVIKDRQTTIDRLAKLAPLWCFKFTRSREPRVFAQFQEGKGQHNQVFKVQIFKKGSDTCKWKDSTSNGCHRSSYYVAFWEFWFLDRATS